MIRESWILSRNRRKTMVIYLVGYVITSILLGLFGYNRKFGFWGYFFGSLLLTPLIGILLVLASDPLPQKDCETCEKAPGGK
jgi:hypothetical protein